METFWLTLILVFFGSLFPNIIKWVMFLLFRTSDEEVQLRGELKTLRRELASVSPVDEFARYARLQRKINKIEEQVMSKGQSRMDVRESLRWKSTKAVQALIGSVLVYITLTCRAEPVAWGLSNNLWPLGSLLQYPTGVEGTVSTVMWLFICNSACRTLIK